MGTDGYRRALGVSYRPDEVVLEVGSGESTRVLASIGPRVVTIDVDRDAFEHAATLPNVEAHHGSAEDVLATWDRPIGFAWLDGFDWPYTGNPPGYYEDQYYRYAVRGATLSQRESQRSHLNVAFLIADHARVIAFDDTWRTHAFVDVGGTCAAPVPPATTPAPRLAMDQPIHRSICGLEEDHPHHDAPARGWSGKGGTAIPHLLERGFTAVEYGLGLVVLGRTDDAR